MASKSIRQSLALPDDEVPSREYARYLTDTTLFHLGVLHHVLDEEGFLYRLDGIYDEGFVQQLFQPSLACTNAARFCIW